MALAISSIGAGVLYFLLQYETFAKTAFPFHENRLMQTIGELADPDLKYWIGRYGGVFILGSLGIAAAAIYYWKQKSVTAAAAIGLLSATVFLHHPLTHWIGHQSADILFTASVPLTAIGISLAITRKQTSKNESVFIIMLVWFILWVSLSRGGKRYDFFIGLPLAFGTAFVIRYLAAYVSENKELVTHRKWALPPQIMATGITIALLILLLFWNPIGGHATRALHVAKVQNIYPENQNIRHVYNWIKTQLPSDKTVMAAQWDYGAQLNVHSNVKTITDPDHYLPHWVHLYDRHVYCAQSETEALYFLKTHHATHLMITSTDVISNAWKNSFVGSDITFDRHFNLHPLLYMPTAPGTQYSLMPQHRLTPSAFTQETDLNFVEIKGQSIKELTVLAHFKTEKNIQIPYIAFHGSTRIRPSQTDKTQKGGLILTFDKQEILRNAYYVPEIGWNSLAFKLFIRGEHSNAFESIYTQKTKEKDVPPDVQIWKINYPENIKPHPKYLKTE